MLITRNSVPRRVSLQHKRKRKARIRARAYGIKSSHKPTASETIVSPSRVCLAPREFHSPTSTLYEKNSPRSVRCPPRKLTRPWFPGGDYRRRRGTGGLVFPGARRLSDRAEYFPTSPRRSDNSQRPIKIVAPLLPGSEPSGCFPHSSPRRNSVGSHGTIATGKPQISAPSRGKPRPHCTWGCEPTPSAALSALQFTSHIQVLQ